MYSSVSSFYISVLSSHVHPLLDIDREICLLLYWEKCCTESTLIVDLPRCPMILYPPSLFSLSLACFTQGIWSGGFSSRSSGCSPTTLVSITRWEQLVGLQRFRHTELNSQPTMLESWRLHIGSAKCWMLKHALYFLLIVCEASKHVLGPDAFVRNVSNKVNFHLQFSQV